MTGQGTRERACRRRGGFTLMEVMMATAILTIVMGVLFTLWLGISDTANVQEAKAVTTDAARQGLGRLVPLLRGAARSSVNWDALPGEVLSFRVAVDLDGNGTAVDSSGNLELGGLLTVQRDVDDLNGDGQTATQLVLIEAAGDRPTVTVLANDICPVNETVDAEGVFGPAQDANGNGRQDRGFWVEASGRGLVVTVGGERTSRKGHAIITDMREFVVPRN